MSRKLFGLTTIAITSLLLINCVSNEILAPQGWREPARDEINENWRKTSAEKFLTTKGDFNGDGIADTAKLLIRKNGFSFGLFVYVSQADSTTKLYMLDEYEYISMFHAMGITTVSTGLYTTACGKGYWTCEPNEVPQIFISHDAVNYFKTESANSFYYFDENNNAFERVWISD